MSLSEQAAQADPAAGVYREAVPFPDSYYWMEGAYGDNDHPTTQLVTVKQLTDESASRGGCRLLVYSTYPVKGARPLLSDLRNRERHSRWLGPIPPAATFPEVAGAPTEDGYYWMEGRLGGGEGQGLAMPMQVVRVRRIVEGDILYERDGEYIVYTFGNRDGHFLADFDCRWWGPIPPPPSAAPEGDEAPAAEGELSGEELLDRALRERGLLRGPRRDGPPPPQGERRPIHVEGEPVSETIIKDRG